MIIYDYDGDYSEEKLDELLKKACQYYDEGNYYASFDCFQKFLDYDELSTYGYYLLVNCLMKTKQHDKVINYGKEWEVKYKEEEPTNYSSLILAAIATSFDIEGDSRNAILYQEKSASIELKLGDYPSIAYAQIALSYLGMEDYEAAINYSKKALKGFFQEYNVTENDIKTRGCNNQNIGRCLYFYATALYGKYDNASGNYIMGLSAKCHYDDAIRFCYKYNIRFN